MKTILIAFLALAPLLCASARADVTDDTRECKYVRGVEGIRGCTALLTEVRWGTNETAWIYFSRGSDYSQLGQDDKAMDDLNEAIRQAPEYVEAYLNRAQIYIQAGKLDLAKADLDKVISLRANYLVAGNGNSRTVRYLATPADMARMTRAQIELQLGDMDGAIADADTARARAPNNPAAEAMSCWVHALKGDKLDAALADCSDAVDATPDRAAFLFRRGFVHYRMNDFADAIKDLDQATTLDGKYEPALYVRGLAKAKAGDAAGSKADIDAATAIRPNVAALFTRYGIGP